MNLTTEQRHQLVYHLNTAIAYYASAAWDSDKNNKPQLAEQIREERRQAKSLRDELLQKETTQDERGIGT